MADFYPIALQTQTPDILGSYIRGQMAPLQVQAAQQQVTAGGLDIDKLRLALEQQKQVMGYASQLAGSQTAGAQNPAGQSGGIQNGPQAQVSSQAPQQSSGSYDGSFGSNPRVNTMMALDVLAGRDPLKTAQSAQEYEIKQRQLQVQGPLAVMDTVAASASPARIVMNNPGMMQRWQQLAPQLGFDPVKDFNDNNVRTAITFARNQVAGSAGLPTKELPHQMQDVAGPLGSIYQRDTVDNKLTKVKDEEPLKDVIGDNGQPTNMRASQAEGKQPFNQGIYGAANISDQQKQLAYDTYLTTGGKLPSGMMPRSDAAKAQLMGYIADRAKAEGRTAESIAAQGQATQATQGVVKDFTSGQTKTTLNGLNTAISHMDILQQASSALGNGDIQALNKVKNFFGQQFGGTGVNNFNVVRDFAAGEVAKAVLPGGGGEKEREDIASAIKNSSSPQQLSQAIDMWRQLLAGKTDALRNQWDVGTRGTQGSFDKFLLPATKKALGISDQAAPNAAGGAHPQDIQDLLSKYGH